MNFAELLMRRLVEHFCASFCLDVQVQAAPAAALGASPAASRFADVNWADPEIEKEASEKRAILMYAREVGRPPSSITLQEIDESCEGGLAVWASKGLDTSSRSPQAQAFGRALKHQPQLAEVYTWLSSEMKTLFRQSWAVKKDWDWVHESRTVTSLHRKSETTIGCWCNSVMLANKLGGYQFEASRAEAAKYEEQCRLPQHKDSLCSVLHCMT